MHTADAHVQGIVFAVFAFDLKLGQIILVQQFCQGTDECWGRVDRAGVDTVFNGYTGGLGALKFP